ncbi:hypothetical protein EOL96_00790 [Candidatus Saccharibacteria bacterium]|nr:hypothetical protein [Candidatus Saccharibacteria bacterium]
MTYTPTVTQTGQKWAHSISMVVTNTGTLDVESWQVKVDIPADQSQLSCPATVSCSVVGTTLRVANGTTNGTIIGGDSLTIVWSYVTALDAYILQNVFVSGVRPSNFAPISGLTASYTQGSRTKSANIYSWPVTFTVTNNSGQNITAWQLSQDWSTAESVGTMPITVTYVASPPTLVITSTTGVNNGSNFQFTATLRSTNRNWAPTGIVVQGKL